MRNKTALFYIIGGLILYLVSTGISYAAFTVLQKGKAATKIPLPSNATGHFVIDPSIPRTEECPLNGQKFTKQEREIWEKRRPLAVMIENHEESRPQTGLSFADVVYEAVAEGGVTRFMGIYYCGIAAYNIGLAPVRSARTYYLDWVSEYDALYNHVGGAGRCNDSTVDERAKALCQIDEYGIKDLDQFSISFPTCYRNYDRLEHPVATEHTMVCFTNKLYDLADERGWTDTDEDGIAWDENFVSWKFTDEVKSADSKKMESLSFTHWQGYDDAYGVRWDYNATNNLYQRFNGNKPHLDLENNQQLTATNVVIQFLEETDGVDEHAHVLYGTIGEGKALIFQNGQAIESTWEKPKRTARTLFFDKTGKEIKFVPGPIWIEIVAIGTEVTY